MSFVGPLGLTIAEPSLAEDLRAGLAAVEQLLYDTTKSDSRIIAEASRHLIAAGGKRFRPMLVLLAAQFGDPHAPGVESAAAVIELTHLASLYHDDVTDEATLRRGVPSANVHWGNKVAILSGDLLFAKAGMLLAELSLPAVQMHAQTCNRLITGQLRESVGPAPGEAPIEHYYSVIADKTSSLIATACRMGSYIAGAPDHAIEMLAQCGERIGVAFQLGDDVLDVVGDEAESGKLPGADIRQRVRTLPVLYALGSVDPADRRLQELLAGPLDADADLAEALTLLRHHPAIDAVRNDLESCVDAARRLIAQLPAIPARAALDALCDVAVHRVG